MSLLHWNIIFLFFLCWTHVCYVVLAFIHNYYRFDLGDHNPHLFSENVMHCVWQKGQGSASYEGHYLDVPLCIKRNHTAMKLDVSGTRFNHSPFMVQ